MTLENISNIDGLFAVINQCTGNVELISDEGDCINLKSRLAQYMTVAGAFSDGYIRSLRLRVEKDEDKVRIFDFIREVIFAILSIRSISQRPPCPAPPAGCGGLCFFS